MFAVGIECSNPVVSGNRRVDELEATGHYAHWKKDLSLVRDLGLRYLRYGPPIHRVYLGPGQYDWDFMDRVMAEMSRLGIRPIIDLVHFGLPDWLGKFPESRVAAANRRIRDRVLQAVPLGSLFHTRQ